MKKCGRFAHCVAHYRTVCIALRRTAYENRLCRITVFAEPKTAHVAYVPVHGLAYIYCCYVFHMVRIKIKFVAPLAL